jgi:hypothetical protein
VDVADVQDDRDVRVGVDRGDERRRGDHLAVVGRVDAVGRVAVDRERLRRGRAALDVGHGAGERRAAEGQHHGGREYPDGPGKLAHGSSRFSWVSATLPRRRAPAVTALLPTASEAVVTFVEVGELAEVAERRQPVAR